MEVNNKWHYKNSNRLSAFKNIDKQALQPLPEAKYEYSEWKKTKVQFNCHVEFEGFFYSVHHSYIKNHKAR